MNRKRNKRKQKRKAKEYEYGSMRYAAQAGILDPREYYHMKLEQLKQKRDKLRICSMCGNKAEYAEKKLFQKPIYYCKRCMEEHKK